MPTPRFSVHCTALAEIATGVYDIYFEKPAGFTFTPGKFVLWDVPKVDAATDIQPRSFSIASLPSEPGLRFIIKYPAGGRASEWIKQQFKVGMEVSMQGPLGRFKLHPGEKDIILVCTGAGLGPFRPMIIDALQQGDRRQMDLVFGVRTEKDLFWTEEFEALTKQHENFFLHLALSDPTPAWTGHRGRVQSLVALIAKDIAQKHVYACGSPIMTNDVKKHCLEEWGLTKQDVHVEGYI